MLPYAHLLIGLIVSVFLYVFIPGFSLIEMGIFFSSSVLLDFDHYIYYALKEKKFNPLEIADKIKKENKVYLSIPRKERNNSYLRFCIFHGFEWVILFFVLGIFVSKYFLFVSLGIAFHLFLDILDHYRYNDRLERVSFIHDFIKFKKLKKL